jgi:hypothetical protein
MDCFSKLQQENFKEVNEVLQEGKSSLVNKEFVGIHLFDK